MFDFSIAPEVQDLLVRVRRFIDEVVLPAEAHAHDDPLEGLPPSLLAELRAEAKHRGLYAPTMPTALGGLGLSITQFAPVLEVAGRSLIGPMALGCAAPDEGNMHLLHLYATPAQRARYLEPLVRGDIFSAFGMTEPAPGAGSDPSMLRTAARVTVTNG